MQIYTFLKLRYEQYVKIYFKEIESKKKKFNLKKPTKLKSYGIKLKLILKALLRISIGFYSLSMMKMAYLNLYGLI